MTRKPTNVRRVLAGISLVIFLTILFFAAWTWQSIGIVKDRDLTDLLKAAIDLKLEQSKSEFQLALVMMGALWGLMIAKKDEARIVLSDRPELLMFCCASVLLICSCISHFVYVDNIAYVFWLAGSIESGKSIPDVFESGVNNPFRSQLWCLLGGFFVGMFTLFSAYKLK